MKKSFALLIALALCTAGLNAAELRVKAKKSKNTKVEPIFIEKIGGTAEGEDGEPQELEGILFLFEITKLKKNDKVLYLQELRDFTIDGASYAQITEERLGIAVEPHSELLESRQFVESYPDAKKMVKNEKNGIIMQTVIYGAELPDAGRVSVTVQVGWADLNEEKTGMRNGEIEDFDFAFELSALAGTARSSEITSKEKKALLKLIDDFKKDTDFSEDNLNNYSHIIAFASENEQVQITIGPDCLPEEVISSKYASVFLLAYICGNLERQLVSGNYANAPEAGIQLELLKYTQIKERDKDISIRFFEDLP